MGDASAATPWARFRTWVSAPQLSPTRVIHANDGIIATAGLLEGFAGAGAVDSVLMLAAVAATIAGSLSIGGAEWSEAPAEREAVLLIASQEAAELAARPEVEFAELVAYWQERGLSKEVAEQVSRQLSARDALAAQLAYEHGIDELPSLMAPILAGASAAGSFLVGAAIPLLITIFFSVRAEPWAILGAVIISLFITSLIAWRAGHLTLRRVLGRSLLVGIGTLLISFAVGRVLF